MAEPNAKTILLALLLLTFKAGLISGLRDDKTVPKCPANQLDDHDAAATSDNRTSLAPADMTPVSAHLAFITSINGEAKKFGGAFFLAVDQLNADAKRDGIPADFSWSFHNTDNSEAHSAKVMSDLYFQRNVSVFIGPESFCHLGAVMANAYNIPYITFDCADGHNSTVRYHYMTVNTKFYFAYAALYLVEIMRHYEWTSAWIIRGTDFKWESTARELLQEMHKHKIRVNGETTTPINDKYSPVQQIAGNSNTYVDLVKKSKDLTR
ncbi:hypothetical protein EGW08_022414, partial [Elysia chlorotica]